MELNISDKCTINNSCNLNSTSLAKIQAILDYLDWTQFLEKDIPVVTILGVICILGIVGNSHAFVVFHQRYPVSSVTTLIKWMVLADLITCVVCIPLEMVQIRYTYTYLSRALCKITRFLTHFATLTAGILLLSIAVERRQKICAPLQWQLSLHRSKCLGVFVTIFSIFVSIPAAIYYDVNDRETNIAGVDGSDSPNPKGNLQAKIYAIFVSMIISFGFVICAVAYIQIVNVIRKQLKGEKNRSSPYKVTTLTQMSPEVRRRSESTMSDNGKMLTLQKRKNREQCYKDSRMITITLLIATGVSFAGYIIHFSAIIIRTEVKRDVLQQIQSLYSVLVRDYFLHSAVHPIVYYLVDQRFRTACNLIYRELKQCLCKQIK
jgi:hypothetical protein